MNAQGNNRLAYLMLSLAAVFWGGNALIGRAFHDDVPPVTLAFWRWALATLLLAPFAWARVRDDRAALLRGWRIMVLLSLLGISAFHTLQYHAAHTTTATNIGLIQTMMPALIVGLGWLLFRDAASGAQLLGVMLAMAGGVVAVTRGDIGRLLTLELVQGDLWMAIATVLYALYSLLLRSRPPVHAISFLFASFALGTVSLAPLYLWERAHTPAPVIDSYILAGVAYIAIGPSILAYLFWNRGVALVGAGRAGLFITLVPVSAAVLGFLFLSEHAMTYHVISFSLIVAGLVLFNRSGATPHRPDSR